MEPREWFQSLAPHLIIPTIEDKREKFFYRSMWPMSNPYYSSFHPVFYASLADPSILSKLPVVLLRDGLHGLLRFFMFMLSCVPKDQVLMIHSDLYHFIPPKMKERVCLYNIANIKEGLQEVSSRKKIILYSYIEYNIMSDSFITSFIEKISALLGSLNNLEVEIFVKIGPIADNTGMMVSIVREIERNLGRITKVWQTKDLMENIQKGVSFADYYLVEINNKMLYADDYLTHALMAAGGYFLNPHILRHEEDQLDLLFVKDLSLFHQITVYKYSEKWAKNPVSIYKNLNELFERYKMRMEFMHVDKRYKYHFFFENDFLDYLTYELTDMIN